MREIPFVQATAKLLVESIFFSLSHFAEIGVFRLIFHRQILAGEVGGCILAILEAVTLGVKFLVRCFTFDEGFIVHILSCKHLFVVLAVVENPL